MWDDIVIGKGDQGTTAFKVFEIDGGARVSENKVSYWISGCFLDIGLTIFKDTKEGQMLSGMINEAVEFEKINQWLDELVIKKLNPKDLMKKIKESQSEFYEKGKTAKLLEIKSVLGIDY